jgi:hypothetical protein
VSYVDAGYLIGIGGIFLYALSLLGRHRRLARAVQRVERDGRAEREQ